MTFDLGQGAGTSLTDGVTLGDFLSKNGVTTNSLRAFEHARRSVTLPLVKASRQIGAATAWGGPLGPRVNATILRTIAAKITPRLLKRDARSHAALSPIGETSAPPAVVPS
jgi:2-polyprenyl-6-methoxyphenol hydroxylase-like FAD-dependent oxidoreductase